MTQFTPSVKRVGQADVSSKLKLGSSLMKQKRLDEAQKEFEEALKADPASDRALLALGTIAYRLGRYDESVGYFSRAAQLQPTKPGPHMKMGRVYLKQKEAAKALQEFLDVIKINPKTTLAHVGAGEAYFRQRSYDQAIQEFKVALSLNPQLSPVRQRLALALSNQGKVEEATKELQSAIRIRPKEPKLHAGLGRLAILRNDFPTAVEAFSTAINLYKGDQDGYKGVPESPMLGLAEALIGGNRYDEAVDILQAMPQKSELSSRHHKLWGDIYTGKGLFKEAAQAYQASSLAAADDSDADSFNVDSLLADQEDLDWEMISANYRNTANNILDQKRKKFSV
jgi:tetratricopeptide (TPR) repeat protein